MNFLSIIFFVGFSHCSVVRRDADPDNLGLGYGAGIVTGGVTGVSPKQVSQPVCNSVPQKVCKDRSVETPRKVCHTEHDEIVDTTIIEKCEERVTTKCEQTSSQSRATSAVIGQTSKVVAAGIVASGDVNVGVGPSVATGAVTGYGGYGAGGLIGGAGGVIGSGGLIGAGGLSVGTGYAGGLVGYTKRDADAGFTGGVAVANTGVSPVSTSAPICRSVPVRHCDQVPVNRPRKVARTVCKTVVDIKIIKDCTDTVSTTCTQSSVQQSQSSAVVGTNSHDGPYAVVAEHGTVAVGGASSPAVVGAGVAGGVATAAGYGVGGVIGNAGGVIGNAVGVIGNTAGVIGGVSSVISA